MTVQESVALIYQQIQIFFIYLARPIVQRQLLLLMAVLVLAWAVPYGLRYWLRVHQSTESTRQRRRRLLTERFYLLFAPILALSFNMTAITILRYFDYPYGILWSSLGLLWAFLAYRAVLTFLYGRYGQRARPYHHWVFLPPISLAGCVAHDR